MKHIYINNFKWNSNYDILFKVTQLFTDFYQSFELSLVIDSQQYAEVLIIKFTM